MLTVLAIITLFGTSLAQRPSNASTCDYYAETLYGANNSNTQFQLVQHIIALAFGGAFNLSNVSSNITGILNPGSFNGLNVDLQPWFNGSIDSTNLNNQPVGINWLDDGGLDPLYDYLSGKTPNVTFSSDTTNE
ncbi:hypothetical protein MMC08_008164, partial [Hypocenomyce scalaris]|nr:hypothetical protein [Hypocenomyce scalaris]